MQFLDAVKIVFKKYADFRGTATRSEYWWFTLFVFLVGLIAGSVDLAIRQSDLGPIQSIVSVALFLPQLTVMVRRNRDAGFSAFWLLLWAIPFIVTVVSFVFNADAVLNFVTSVNSADTLTDQQAVDLLVPMLSVIVPALLAFSAVGIFFFVVSLLPSKKPKIAPAVATIDY